MQTDTTETITETGSGVIVEEPTHQPQQIELAITGTEDGQRVQAKFRLTETGLVVQGEPTFPEWVKGLEMFKWGLSRMRMGLSDYVRYGEVKYGKERVHASMQQLEFDMPTVKAVMDIASVPEEMRHPSLTSEHYVILARSGLPEKSKTKWAKAAHDHVLTPSQLKRSIRLGEVSTDPGDDKRNTGIVSIQGILAEFNVWLNRVGGYEGVAKQPNENLREILTQLQPMHDLYEDIELVLRRESKEQDRETVVIDETRKKPKPAKKAAKKKASKKKQHA